MGVVLGARESLKGSPSINRAETLAYLNLPVRFDITRRIGVTLDATVGSQASWRSKAFSDITGVQFEFGPNVGLNASVDF